VGINRREGHTFEGMFNKAEILLRLTNTHGAQTCSRHATLPAMMGGGDCGVQGTVREVAYLWTVVGGRYRHLAWTWE